MSTSGASGVHGLDYTQSMPTEKKEPRERKPATSRGLVREVCYLHPDEVEALVRRAETKMVSKSEIMRRALRGYLGIED
jgi:Ribbon-helix-helix protein, copG family